MSVSTMSGPEFLDTFRTANVFGLPPSICTQQSFIDSHGLFSPAQYDLAMIRTDSQLGKLKVCARRLNRDQKLIRLDSFAYGFSFAFGMALVRYIWAK